MTVSTLLTLTQGVLKTTSADILTVTSPFTTVVSVGNNTSYIDGPLKYVVATSTSRTYLFPIGKDGDWRPLELTTKHSDATSCYYIAELFVASADALGYTLPAGYTHVSKEHYWDISREAVANLDITPLTDGPKVKLYYSNVDGENDGVSDLTNLGMVKSTGSVSPWIDIYGTAGTAAPAGSITSTNFTAFSKFALGNKTGGTNTLPIKLLSFNAKETGKNVNLDWQTSTETNNDYFTVERSGDGKTFEEVTWVKGAGNSTELLNYQAVDENPYNGTSFYRLKQSDYDGKYTYSKIVAVNMKEANGFGVFPNPVRPASLSSIHISGIEEGGEVLVTVYDAKGRAVYSNKIITGKSGESLVSISSPETLSSGMYFITATTNQQVYRQKLLVE